MGWGSSDYPTTSKEAPGGVGKGPRSMDRFILYCCPNPVSQGQRHPPRRHRYGSSSPALPRLTHPFWHLEGIELRSWSSGGSCSFGSNCCILFPSLCHSAWFGAHNFLLGHPLRLAGLSSPGAPQSRLRPLCCWACGLGFGLLQPGPASELPSPQS